MNFLDYPAYVMGCLGIGDIICSLNALENLGREKRRRILVYVCHLDYFARARCIYEALDLKLVDLQCIDYDYVKARWGDEHTIFQAFGTEVSWVKEWLYGWGLRESLGHEAMVPFRHVPATVPGSVGVSFTLTWCPARNISRESVVTLISKLLRANKHVTYFGYRETEDDYLLPLAATGLSICPHDLSETITRIGMCETFLGADSGMAWLAVFSRVKTTILVGRSCNGMPRTHSDIPWVGIEREAA